MPSLELSRLERVRQWNYVIAEAKQVITQQEHVVEANRFPEDAKMNADWLSGLRFVLAMARTELRVYSTLRDFSRPSPTVKEKDVEFLVAHLETMLATAKRHAEADGLDPSQSGSYLGIEQWLSDLSQGNY